MDESILVRWTEAAARFGVPCALDRSTLRAGPFPLGRAAALRVVEADRAGAPPDERAVFHRAARAWASFVPAAQGGGFEAVLGTADADEPLGPAPSEEPPGVVCVAADESWWLVVEGELLGTVWAQWEGRWVPAYEVEGEVARLATVEEWHARTAGLLR